MLFFETLLLVLCFFSVSSIYVVHPGKARLGFLVLSLVLISGMYAVFVSYKKKHEKYDFISRDGDYNYDQENPEALRTGRSVAGTVYASYPGNVPGLGWVM